MYACSFLLPPFFVLVLLDLVLGASDSKLATNSQCRSPGFLWALPDPNATVSWKALVPAADVPHPHSKARLCPAKHTMCVAAISQNSISCVPKLQVVKTRLSCKASFKNCKLKLIAFCSHCSLLFAVRVLCSHPFLQSLSSLFLALIVLCIQHLSHGSPVSKFCLSIIYLI